MNRFQTLARCTLYKGLPAFVFECSFKQIYQKMPCKICHETEIHSAILCKLSGEWHAAIVSGSCTLWKNWNQERSDCLSITVIVKNSRERTVARLLDEDRMMAEENLWNSLVSRKDHGLKNL